MSDRIPRDLWAPGGPYFSSQSAPQPAPTPEPKQVSASLPQECKPQPPFVFVNNLPDAIASLAALAGYKHSKDLASFDPAGETKAALIGLGSVTSSAAACVHGMSALRWLLQQGSIHEGDNPEPIDYANRVRVAKMQILEYTAANAIVLRIPGGRFYFAAVALTAMPTKALTVIQAAILFCAAYELEEGLSPDDPEHGQEIQPDPAGP